MQRLCYRRFHLFTMKFLNDLWSLKKAELAFMAEHWGIYLVLGIGLICLCVYVISPRTMTMNYRYRRAQQRNWEIETHQWFLLFMEFLWKLQNESYRVN